MMRDSDQVLVLTVSGSQDQAGLVRNQQLLRACLFASLLCVFKR